MKNKLIKRLKEQYKLYLDNKSHAENYYINYLYGKVVMLEDILTEEYHVSDTCIENILSKIERKQ